MECYKLFSDMNLCDYKHPKRWMPRVVLIDKSDVLQYSILNNRISFELSKKAVAYKYPDNLNDVLGNFEITELFGYKQYRHNVQIPIVDYRHWAQIEELTKSEFFVALIDNRNNVFIFGFEYGLEAQDGLVEHTNYSTITLRSSDAGLENRLPLLFTSDNPKDDFYNNFEDSEVVPLGEFSDDFSNDFFI